MKDRRKKTRKQFRTVKPGLVSNIKINNKVTIIIALLLMCLVVIVYGAYNIVAGLESDSKSENERMVTSAAERYVENEIDSMVRISEAVYRNEDIYDLINKRYSSVLEYHEAFYDFDTNRFPSSTAGSAVEQLVVYTSNDTVMNGKYIGRLNDVKNEEWYLVFRHTDRDVIIYCDNEYGRMSLIRKLNYKKTVTGDAVIKLDFNASRMQESLSKISFDGEVYAASSGMLLCSNQKTTVLPASLDGYSRSYKNFYTCNIDFFVKAYPKDVMSVFAVPFAVPLFVMLVFASVLVLIIIYDLKNRILVMCETYGGSRQNFKSDEEDAKRRERPSSLGKDEIGVLYDKVGKALGDVNMLKESRKKISDFNTELKETTNQIILKALNYETYTRFGAESPESMSEVISLDSELHILGALLNELKEHEYFKYTLLADTNSTAKKVLPYSLAAIALHVARYNGTGGEVEIEVTENTGFFIVRFRKASTSLSSADLLKLRAVFEAAGETDQPSYTTEDEFNPYVRLSRFHKDIRFDIKSKDVLDFEFIISDDKFRKEK